MSVMVNTTPLVTTVIKPVTNPKDVDATLRVNIQDLCKEYYEDILPIIMDKVRRDKRKEVYARITLKRMSVMVNTTPLVTTVIKPVTNPKDVDATLRVNIQDLCKEYYEDILPIIMDKVRRDKRKEVYARLDFRKSSRERRTREDSHYSSARARTKKPERLTV
nr:hypothetical protein [Tanacetum cinerariifolium]